MKKKAPPPPPPDSTGFREEITAEIIDVEEVTPVEVVKSARGPVPGAVHFRTEIKKVDAPPKSAPIDYELAESQLGWWVAMRTGDVRLFEAWLSIHGAIVISAQTIDHHDAFFQALSSRRTVHLADHPAGFVFRRSA